MTTVKQVKKTDKVSREQEGEDERKPKLQKQKQKVTRRN